MCYVNKLQKILLINFRELVHLPSVKDIKNVLYNDGKLALFGL